MGRSHRFLIVAGAALLAGAAHADGLDVLRQAVTGGTPNLDVRLRYENVDQDNALANADAITARARLGYTTGRWNALDAQLEYEGVETVDDPEYSSGRPGGRTGFSIIADPRASELNQAWLRYAGIPGTVLKAGRQRIVLDNARFVGNSGWRQNEQTFDGAVVANTSLPKTTLTAGFVTNVDTPLATDLRLHGTLLNARFAPLEAVTATAYGYLLDWSASATSPAAAPGAFAPPQREDTQTVGLRLAGVAPAGPVKLGYAAEYARQSDYADSTVGDHDYLLAEVAVTGAGVTGKLGYEQLGGDGTTSFQTPLATLHAFQGWADQFLVTPKAGLQEVYLSAATTIASVALLVRGSRFASHEGSIDYADELDAQATWPVSAAFALGAKLANFDARTAPLADTKKLWAWVEYRFQ